MRFSLIFMTLVFGLLLGCASNKTRQPADLDAYQDSQTFSSPSNYQSSQNAAEVAATAVRPISSY